MTVVQRLTSAISSVDPYARGREDRGDAGGLCGAALLSKSYHCVLIYIRIEVGASISPHCSSLFALLRASGHVFARLRTSFLHIISTTCNHALLDPHCIHAPPLSTRPTYSIRHRLLNENIRRRVQLSEVYSHKHGIDSKSASKNPTGGVRTAAPGHAHGHQSSRTYS